MAERKGSFWGFIFTEWQRCSSWCLGTFVNLLAGDWAAREQRVAAVQV